MLKSLNKEILNAIFNESYYFKLIMVVYVYHYYQIHLYRKRDKYIAHFLVQYYQYKILSSQLTLLFE